MKYGIELEFFVKNKKKQFIPAYLETTNLDGNPVIGEVRTKVHSTLVDCIYELKKLVWLERCHLESKGCSLEIIPEIKVESEFLKALRRDESYINRKELEKLEDYSVYGKETGKILPSNLFKASLQLSISENKKYQYNAYNKVEVGKKYKYDIISKEFDYCTIFNFPEIIRLLDTTFSKDITKAKRVSGVYAIKKGEFGQRIEYRSLPNNIDLNTLLKLEI